MAIAGLTTTHQEALYETAKAYIDLNGPTSGTKLAGILHCDTKTAHKIAKLLKVSGKGGKSTKPGITGNPQPAAKLAETDETAGDKRTITMPRTRIHTLAQLVKACDIDLNEWFVERFVCNKWEMGYIQNVSRTERTDSEQEPATEIENEGNETAPENQAAPEVTKVKRVNIEKTSSTQSLYQVKAFLARRVVTEAGNTVFDEGGYISEIAGLRGRLEKQNVQIRKEKAISKHNSLNHFGADDFLKKLHGFMDKMGDCSLPYERPVAHAPIIDPVVREGHTEDAVALWSDMHFGDRTRREDMSGFPKFDMPVSGNRWGYVIRKMKQCLTLHRAMYPLDTLNIWIGGDVGNGILHDSPNSNELFTPAQVHFSYHMLKFAIEDALTLCKTDESGKQVVKKIKLLFTVGNHMRMDEKMPYKFQAQRTLDWLIYQFVIERFAGNPNIEIKQEMAPYIFENIRGHRHLFAHGMQVGYRNSPDAQCKSMASFIDRVRALFDSPEWRNANKLQGETFSRICIGDIHVPVSFPRLISNGSLNGQNELGVNWVMEPIPAGQQLFGVSDKHLETWKYFLDATHIQDAPCDMNPYGIFAKNYADKLGR
jgi:hypothetical protein